MANWQRGLMRAMRIVNHPVEVVGVHDYTQWYRRITFHAPDLVRDVDIFPTLWLRLWVPNPDKGPEALSQRGYTFIDIRPEQGTFALDFVLHTEGGPASAWARQAAVGATTEVALTPARIELPADTSRLLLAGDITAYPAILTWLAAAPAELPIQVLLEDDHDQHAHLPAVPRENTSWTWCEPGANRGTELAEHIRSCTRQEAGLYAWAAGEKGLVKALRPVLREDLGLERGHQFTQFYWIESRANG